MLSHNSPGARITYDEIGLAFGHFAGHVLKSAFQPIFEIRDGHLIATAAKGIVRPSIGNEHLTPLRLLDRVDDGERVQLGNLCRSLHVANSGLIGVDDLDVFLTFDPANRDELDLVLPALGRAVDTAEEDGFERPKAVCEIQISQDDGFNRELAASIREAGHKIAVDNFGGEDSLVGVVDAMRPDFVRVSGRWFRQVARVSGAASLLGSLVGALRSQGIRVLIEGIETSAQLAVALEAQADLLQGFALSAPIAAGAHFPDKPLDVAVLLEPGAQIIPLRRPA